MAKSDQAAPLYAPVFGAARPVEPVFRCTEDGVRLRMAVWTAPSQRRGTVFILQGRTEYLEKYTEAVAHFWDAGFSVCALDWRGQGLSDRLLDNRLIGHVGRFEDYLLDLQCLVDHATAQALPHPWGMLGHSMGGAIGLRALQAGFAFERAAFSGPMWDIRLLGGLRWLSPHVTRALQAIGLGDRFVPSGKRQPYLLIRRFAGNKLTSDAALYAKLKLHLEAHPDLAVAAPSVTWLQSALQTCDAIAQDPAPSIPMLAVVGTEERIVDQNAIKRLDKAWPNLSVRWYRGGRHELLMEREPLRQACLADITAFLAAMGDCQAAG